MLTARDEVYRVVEAISKRVEKCHALGLSDHEETLSIRDVLKLSVDRGEQNFPTSFPNIPHTYECCHETTARAARLEQAILVTLKTFGFSGLRGVLVSLHGAA